jgi:hypothetical protein
VAVERSGDATTIVVRPNPSTDTGVVRFEVRPATLSMYSRNPRVPERREWERGEILDVTISSTANNSRVEQYELRIHLKTAAKFDAVLESVAEPRLEPVLSALRDALGLLSRAEAARAWLGTAPANLPDDAKAPGDVLPYAPEPQDMPSIERTPGVLRIFVPRERVTDTLNSTPPALLAVVITLLASLFLAWWFAPSARAAIAIAFMSISLVVVGGAAAVGPVVQRWALYRKIEFREDMRLVLTVRSPFKTSKRAWHVDEIREVIRHAGFPRFVGIRLAKRWVELSGFRARADAEAVADVLSHALGFAAGPTRR